MHILAEVYHWRQTQVASSNAIKKLKAVAQFLYTLRRRIYELMQETDRSDQYPFCVKLLGSFHLYRVDLPVRAEQIVSRCPVLVRGMGVDEGAEVSVCPSHSYGTVIDR